MELGNNVIRVSYNDLYPMVNLNCTRVPVSRPSSSCQMPGVAVEIINLLTTALNLTIEPHLNRTQASEKYGHVFENINSSNVDLHAGMFEDTVTRKLIYDFSVPLYEMKSYIVVRRAENSLTNIFDFFLVYKLNTWISMIAVFLIFTLFGCFVRYVECQLRLRKDVNLSDIIWRMIRFQLIQSNGLHYNLKAGGTSLFVFSFFQVCIILGLFQGFILSRVVKQKTPFPFDGLDFPRLLKDRTYFMVTMNGTTDWYLQEIENSYQTPFYQLREAKTVNPFKLVDTAKEVLDTINEVNGAVTILDEDQNRLFEAKKYCDLVFIDSQIRFGNGCLMFRKGSPLVKHFNKAILENQILITRIYRKYMEYKQHSTCQPNNNPTALSLAPYYGVLMLFFVGTSTACFMFGGELLRVYYNRK